MKEIRMKCFTGSSMLVTLLVCMCFSACAVPVGKPPQGTGPLNEQDAEPQPPGDLGGTDQETLENDTELSAHLELPERLQVGEGVNLAFTLTNRSETPMYVLKWYTPLEGIAGEIFKVTRDGQAVPYAGILASRIPPTPDQYIHLDAGESVSTVVDLGTSFDFSRPGSYTIRFVSPRISHIAYTEAEKATSMGELGPVQISSNPVLLEIIK